MVPCRVLGISPCVSIALNPAFLSQSEYCESVQHSPSGVCVNVYTENLRANVGSVRSSLGTKSLMTKTPPDFKAALVGVGEGRTTVVVNLGRLFGLR